MAVQTRSSSRGRAGRQPMDSPDEPTRRRVSNASKVAPPSAYPAAAASSPTKEALNDIKQKGGFIWSPSEEPHARRRAEILRKHPEIKELFGPDPRTKYVVVTVVLFQYLMAYLLRNATWPVLLLTTYVVGGTFNHMLMMAVHELSHNLAFKGIFANRVLGIISNTAMGIPSAITFKRYHMEHHKYQGEDEIDVDIPTVFEGNVITNILFKLCFVILQPFFYAIRPLIVAPKKTSTWEIINFVSIAAFVGSVYLAFGPKPVVYFVAGSLLGAGFHPCAGHFIAEHYVYTGDQETYSYYGPINWVTFNVGYHNEHHDFPNIPGFRLPEVKKLAPEYYDNLPSYNSYLYVLWRYIFDSSIGPFSRVKRATLTAEEKAAVRRQ